MIVGGQGMAHVARGAGHGIHAGKCLFAKGATQEDGLDGWRKKRRRII